MIYKLRYVSKEDALKDLKIKGVIDKEGNYINGTQAVVECGLIVLTAATYKGEAELTPTIFADGYHYDIMTNDTIVFESEIFVKEPKFTFAGQ